jgi:di/tricarboxylate transporter
VLLGAMIPVGEALERTGGVDLLAAQLLGFAGQASPMWPLAVVLIGTMALTPLINNAAAALFLMAPIAFGVARGLEV